MTSSSLTTPSCAGGSATPPRAGVLRKNRGYTLAKTEDRCSHVPLYVFLSQHAVNNTLLMMIVDSGTSTCGAIATIADTSPTTPTSSCSVWTSSRTP